MLRAIGAGEVRGFLERPNSRNGTWGQRDLWEPTDSLSTVSVTSTIKVLVIRGLVERPLGGFRWTWRLTDAGRAALPSPGE